MDENTITTEENQEKKLNVSALIAIAAVVLVMGTGFVFLKGRGTSKSIMPVAKQGTGASMNQTGNQAVEGSTSSNEGEVKVIPVETGSYYYNPKEIRVKKGEKVKIVLTSKDMMHDFNIDEFGVHMPKIKAGNTLTIEFTADKTGEYEYYCSVANHRVLGQVGKLIVE